MQKVLLALTLLLSLSAYGQEPWSGKITIGRFTYLGIDEATATSTYEAFFDTTGVTREPLKGLRMQMIVGPSTLWEGPFETPRLWEEIGSAAYETELWPCGGCAVIALQVFLDAQAKPVTLTLANGNTFKTAGIVTVVISAKPGQWQLLKNQSVPIVLTQIQ